MKCQNFNPHVRKVSCMRKSRHEIFMHETMKFPCKNIHFFMHENDIFLQENDISMHENEDFASGMIFFAPEIAKGNWAVHYFMHGILIHEHFGAKFSFS